MEFIENLSEQEYREFWSNSPTNHFMQSYEWGQACKKNRNQVPFYVGLKDKDKIVAAALLLKKNMPLKLSYFYSPRGFTMDYSNEKILKEFTKGLNEFLKKHNAIYLKLDPPIKYQDIDENADPVENGFNNYELYNEFLKLGYKHQGFNKLYEGNQPRYTFRTYFDKYKSFEEVEATISKTYMRQIKRSYNYDMEISLNDDMKTFHDLVKIISNKDSFNEYDYNYYKNVYDEFSKHNYIKNYVVKINIDNIIEKFANQMETEKNSDRKTKLQKDIDYFNEQKEIYKKSEITIASLICTYSEKGAWSLYIGNDKIAEYTGAVNRLYYEFMKDAYNNKYDYADLFGTVGDPKTKYKNLAGLHEYKRKVGGEYIEFIGEFDLINKPFWYKILPILLKIYRKIKK